MRAAVLEKPGELRVRTVETPVPEDHEVLIKIEYCGICGTDIKLFKGQYSSTLPVIPGHEFSGTIAEVGKNVSGFQRDDKVTADPNLTCGTCEWCKAGKRNFCSHASGYGVTTDGAFAEYLAMPASNVYRLPENSDLLSASFAEPLSCALHAIDIAALSETDSVGIIGGGSQGQMFVQLAKLHGVAEIIMITRSAAKLTLAETLGATKVVQSGDHCKKQIMEMTNTLGLDIIIETAATPVTFKLAVDIATNGGKIIVYGLGPSLMRTDISPYDITTKELSIMGAWLNPCDTFKRAVELLENTIDVAALVSNTIKLEDISSGFELMQNRSKGFIKAVIRMP